LEYPEWGYAFMSACSFHAITEMQKQSVYDIPDFVDAVRKNDMTLEMQSADFLDRPNGVSSGQFTNKPVL
jgi:hypothetical protein